MKYTEDNIATGTHCSIQDKASFRAERVKYDRPKVYSVWIRSKQYPFKCNNNDNNNKLKTLKEGSTVGFFSSML